MLAILRCSSGFCRFALTRILRCRKRLTIKNSNDNDNVAVTPLAISHMPKSVVRSPFAVPASVSSIQMNSQHELPILNEVQPCGGEQSTALHPIGCPLSQMHSLQFSGPGTKCDPCFTVCPWKSWHSDLRTV